MHYWGHLRFALCLGNIPFPLAERSCLDCEEYFGAVSSECRFIAIYTHRLSPLFF